MASICTNKRNNTRRIVFVGLDRKRRTIHCGTAPLRVVKEVARHVDAILAAGAANVPLDATTAAWLGQLSPDWYSKLQAAGLVLPRDDSKPSVPTLAEYAAQYLAKRTDIKPLTVRNFQGTINVLREFFRHDPPLDQITQGDAEDFRRWMLTTKKYSAATTGRAVGRASQLFSDAIKRKIITENPFLGLDRSVKANPARQAYIPAETILQVIGAAPSAEWRLLIALARFLGLRIPSEAFSLKWSDVDWERGRLRVPSPKTEHHVGRDHRVVPILPEVRPFLEEVFETALEGAELVLQRLAERYPSVKASWKAMNLRTTFEKIIQRAGVTPWPRLWHNLRASAQTDLAQRFPLHVVCSWIGNTEVIARDHYLRVTDDHFQAALQPLDESARKTARAVRELASFDAHQRAEHQKTPCFQGVCAQQLFPRGFEPAADAQAIFASCAPDGAPDDARSNTDLADNDPRLALLLELWERLDWDGRQALLDEAERLAEEC